MATQGDDTVTTSLPVSSKNRDFPVFAQAPTFVLGGIVKVLAQRRGQIIDQQQDEGTPMVTIQAFLPVNESFGFTETLRGETGGQAFPQLVFDHWQVLPGNPLDTKSMAGSVVKATRERKGLNPVVPALDNYLDKL